MTELNNLPYTSHDAYLTKSVDMTSTYVSVEPKFFESLQPEPGKSVLMRIEVGEQYLWLAQHMPENYSSQKPVMVQDVPGESNTRYVDLYYQTDIPRTYAQVSYCKDQGKQELEFWNVTVNKMSTEKETQMKEEYGVK